MNFSNEKASIKICRNKKAQLMNFLKMFFLEQKCRIDNIVTSIKVYLGRKFFKERFFRTKKPHRPISGIKRPY